MKFNIFKKKEKKPEVKPQEVNTDTKKVSTNQYRITIKKKATADTYIEIGRFIAFEGKDESNNIIIENEEVGFKSDLEFNKDHFFRTLELQLRINNVDRDKKVKILVEEINKQETLIEKITANVPEGTNKVGLEHTVYNIFDEEWKLNELKILLECCQLDKRGSYMYFGLDGIKCIDFEFIDGMFKPFFWGTIQTRVYPDYTSKKHAYRTEEIIFNEENQEKYVMWGAYIFLAIGVIATLVNFYFLYEKFFHDDEIQLQINAGNFQCQQLTGVISGEVFQDWLKSNTNIPKSSISNPPPEQSTIKIDNGRVER